MSDKNPLVNIYVMEWLDLDGVKRHKEFTNLSDLVDTHNIFILTYNLVSQVNTVAIDEEYLIYKTGKDIAQHMADGTQIIVDGQLSI